MYMDAEERKAELMKDNKLGDGKMFKLDFDPRVIGNKILPDGTHKTGIGDFIRRTSLDEFPQFFNVLRGDMSIIGTRPPLISETNLYELHHQIFADKNEIIKLRNYVVQIDELCFGERQTDFSYLEQTYRELIKREEGISEEYLRILYDDPYKSLKQLVQIKLKLYIH